MLRDQIRDWRGFVAMLGVAAACLAWAQQPAVTTEVPRVSAAALKRTKIVADQYPQVVSSCKWRHCMNDLELVIFDCDGVLVDSERIANQVFCVMLNDLGLPLSLQDMFERFVGLSMNQCVELITDLHGRAPPSTFVDELRQRIASALRDQVRPIPGIEATLAALSIPCCVASSGDHEKIKLTLGATGLLSRFEGKIFSVVDVAKPKPAPDVFLFAARQFGVSPSACAVIEDTPTGVRAAVAAGMRVFGFAANTPAHRLIEAGAHCVFSDMMQLPELLNAVQPGDAADRSRRASPASFCG
jgi:HAD superfamily hydrolase (TIGR01509 family)